MQRIYAPSFVASLLASAPLSAQLVPLQGVPGVPPEYQRMLTELQAAQPSASRPGDANLSCEAIEAELAAITGDPAFQAYIANAGAAAQRPQEQARQAELLAAIMPRLMRNQQLVRLAIAKQCASLTRADALGLQNLGAPVELPP